VIEFRVAHKKYRISELYNSSARYSMLPL